jgi:N-acetylmuramoyl-L-alanine amidase
MVILDAGHGYNTKGKRSPVWSDGSQLFEWEFNRDVVKRIREGMQLLGIKSMALVEEAIDIGLRVRAARANEIAVKFPGSFLISVHGNAGGGEGWEVWTSPGQTESDHLATILFESAKYYLHGFRMRSDFSDGDQDKEAKFTILTKTTCPAVLTENLFYDNERECRFMMSEQGRNLIAKLHIVAIEKYLKMR